MTEHDPNAWEEALIADLREHEGRPTSGPLKGHPLLVMHGQGARSGEPRRAILTYSRQDGDYVVAGTAGGSPTDPSWVANLRAYPDVSVEIGRETTAVTASEATGDERAAAWDEHVRQLPWFAEYPAQTGRDIPMFRLTPRS